MDYLIVVVYKANDIFSSSDHFSRFTFEKDWLQQKSSWQLNNVDCDSRIKKRYKD